MSVRSGRPKKARKQEKHIGYAVTMAQYFIIQQKAAKANVNMSDYMRQTAIFGYVKARWTAEERQMVKELIDMSNDIHQLADLASKEGAAGTALYFTNTRNTIDEIIKKLCHDK
jgi:predicted RNA-binding protein with PIN domain